MNTKPNTNPNNILINCIIHFINRYIMSWASTKPVVIPKIGSSNSVLNNDQIATASLFLNDYLKQFATNINIQFSYTNGILSQLTNNSLAEITDLTSKVNAQNKQLETQTFNNYNKQNKVQNVKNEYGQVEIEIIKKQNYQLLVIYYIFIIVLGGVLFYMRPTLPYWNIAIIIFCLLYPFIIAYIEWAIYTIFQWIVSFFKYNEYTSNVYLHQDKK